MIFHRLYAGVIAGHLVSVVAGATVADAAAQKQKPLEKIQHDQENPFNGNLETFVNDVMDRWKIAGMSVSVIDGESVYAKGYGYAKLPDRKATPETLYFAGSTSKAFTAATLAHMIDSKNFSALADGWDTPISSIIRDDFVMHDSWLTDNINLNDAVSHRTGMPRHDTAWPRYNPDGSILSAANVVRTLRHLKPSAPPRTTWQYCNFMYVVLGHVVETLTGQWLGDAMRERIWAPLGMTATFGDTDEAIAAPEHLASGYYWDFDKAEQHEMPVDRARVYGGAGLIISTVADYSKWVRCLLDETEPFSKNTHQDIRTTRMLTSLKEETGVGDLTYGLAWNKKTHHGEVVYKHGGTTLACSTQVYWLPRLKYGVVAMANSGSANAAEDEIVWRLIEDKLNIPKHQRYSISRSLEESDRKLKKEIENAVDIFYPDRPETRMPCSLNNTQITGKYYDPGYGYLDISETEVSGNTMLVANRSNTIFSHELRLRHATGNYWLADVYTHDVGAIAGSWGGLFNVGVDGEATGIEIRQTPPGEALGEGPVFYKRVN